MKWMIAIFRSHERIYNNRDCDYGIIRSFNDRRQKEVNNEL